LYCFNTSTDGRCSSLLAEKIQYETRPPRWETFRTLNGFGFNFDSPFQGRRDQLRTPVDHAFATCRGRLAANVKDGLIQGTKVLNEEWQHRLYAERDLGTVETPS
jgi:hypothetical protein